MSRLKTHKISSFNLIAWLVQWWRRQGVKQTPLKQTGECARPLHLLTCQIHGSHYYGCIQLVESNQVHKGESLILTREPDNEYDEYAIEVHNQSKTKLGYVPKNHNRVIAELMDQHCNIYAVVKHVKRKEWEPVTIRIEWQLDNV